MPPLLIVIQVIFGKHHKTSQSGPPVRVDTFRVAREFRIDAGRMETDGKGATQPVDKNDNPTGKANNRRVEFIKR